VPQGPGVAPAHPAAGRLTRSTTGRPGGTEWEEPRARHGDGHDRRPRPRGPPQRLAGHRPPRLARRPDARASRTSAARRSTTRRTTSSRSPSPRSARCRSRTRPAYDTRAPSPVWDSALGRGGATLPLQDIQNAGLRVDPGLELRRGAPGRVPLRSMKAKERGAKVFHVDPRTGARARWRLHVPIRAGSDIAFLGGPHPRGARARRVLQGLRPQLHERDDDRQRGLRRRRGQRRHLQRLQPDTGAYDPRRGCTRAARSRVGRRARAPAQAFEAAHRRGDAHVAGRARPDAPAPALRAQHRARHYARYTPEMVSASAGSRPRTSSASPTR
jgi:hypothetical protein